MRALLVLLLFQFISPSLFSVITLGSVSDDAKASYTSAHSSIVVPVFLKEQEEKDHEEAIVKSFDLTPLIDFSNHSLTHTASQFAIFKGYSNPDKFAFGPSLYRLHCTLRI